MIKTRLARPIMRFAHTYHLNKQYVLFLMIKSKLNLAKKGKRLSKCCFQHLFNLLRRSILLGFEIKQMGNILVFKEYFRYFHLDY